MSIQVYKQGTGATIRGVECDFKNITISELNHYLDNGWYKAPGEWEEVTKPDETEEEPTNEIRAAAKEAGLEDWDKKRIKTLENELNDLQNTGD